MKPIEQNTNRIIKGTYLCIGSTVPPTVHILSASSDALYLNRLTVCHSDKSRRDALRITFGQGIEYALPAWSTECMEIVATQYTGPYKNDVKGIAACLALGQPITGTKKGPDGSERVPDPIPEPELPPQGDAIPLADMI